MGQSRRRRLADLSGVKGMSALLYLLGLSIHKFSTGEKKKNNNDNNKCQRTFVLKRPLPDRTNLGI